MVSGAVSYLLQKDIGAAMMTISCILDATDGKLAREYNMRSREGELYDPASDKISETTLSSLSFVNLSPGQSIVQIFASGERMREHFYSQFNEKRGNFKEQFEILKNLVIHGDKNIKYVDGLSTGAANNAGKWKTSLQFTGGLGIIWLHTGIAQQILDTILSQGIPFTLQETTHFLNWLFIGAGVASIPFALKSIQGRKEKKSGKYTSADNDTLLENPKFLLYLLVASGSLFFVCSEIIKNREKILESILWILKN